MNPYTDETWQNWNIQVEAHKFFLLRWEELFDPETFDSWHARTSNAVTILLEILDAVSVVSKVHAYHHNVLSLIEELEDVVKDDLIVRRYYRFLGDNVAKLRLIYETDVKNQQKLELTSIRLTTQALLGTLCDYCDRLFDEIHRILVSPSIKYKIELDTLISLLATQLLFTGYSKEALQESASFLKDPAQASFIDRYESLRRSFSGGTRDYECHFLVSWSGQFPGISSIGIERQSPPVPPPSEIQASFYSQDSQPTAVKVRTKGLDARSACEIAAEILEDAFSTKKLYQSSKQSGIKHPLVLVCSSPDSERLLNFDLRGTWNLKDSKQADHDVVELLHLKSRLSQSDQGYLSSAIEYHKLAALAGTEEARLVNLWIALESLVQHGSNNIIDRITRAIPSSLTTSYLHSQVRAFSEELRFLWRGADQSTLLPKLRSSNKFVLHVDDLLAILLDRDDGELMTAFLDLVSRNPLQLFRFVRLRELCFSSPDRMAARLEKHRLVLEWQIRRIYRMRNNVIHQGHKSSTMSLKFRTVLGILFLGGEQYGKEEAISGFPAFERSKAAAGAGS